MGREEDTTVKRAMRPEDLERAAAPASSPGDPVDRGAWRAAVYGVATSWTRLSVIFSNEYTQAENQNWHLKHFCCFDCDNILAGEIYVMVNDKPVCKPCYVKNHAEVRDTLGFSSLDLLYLGLLQRRNRKYYSQIGNR